MSKQIDWNKPLSDEERAWAEQFPGLHSGLLEANAQAFPPEPESTLEGEEIEEVPYEKWSAAELAEEAKRRNSEDGKSLPTTGKKADLISALEKDDETSA